MTPARLFLAAALAGCTSGNVGTAPPPAIRLDPPTLSLPVTGPNAPPQTAYFDMYNADADRIYVSVAPPSGDGSDLVVIGIDPYNRMAPGQRQVIPVSLVHQPWRWRTGTYNVTMLLEARYYFSGQAEDEPEPITTDAAPTIQASIYELALSFEIDCDEDDDGFDSIVCGGQDCEDRVAAIHPDADETCDGRDEDCNGAIDNDPTDAPDWYYDADLDGIGTPSRTLNTCESPSSYWVATDNDCDDSLNTVRPGAPELCGDQIDNNCNGATDEGC